VSHLRLADRDSGGSVTTANGMSSERLLTVEAAAERMSTSVRFVRRLIAERRIAFVKLGRHVRIAESDIAAYIEAGRVDPFPVSETWRVHRRSA
jgi:excisionase family DNA binding protein